MFVNLSTEESLKKLNVNADSGLTDEEVSRRKNQYGINLLTKTKPPTLIARFFSQFKDALIIILLIAAVISIIVDPGEWIESLIILFVVLINASLGVFQENKAEKSLEALMKLSSPLAMVIRNENTIEVESSDLVPGDIILIEAGNLIPADARIIEAMNLKVDESALTGESVPVEKNSDAITGEGIPLGDQKNMIFSSTISTYGRGVAVITNIGMDTEIGKIANLLSETKTDLTPLQVKLNQLGKSIGFLAIIVCVVIFILEVIANTPPLEAFKTSVALAVAAIPEGLSTVVTIVLAIGVDKMAKNRAIVKKLPAVETLGSTSIVCSDKTGTLTQNKMTVVKIYQDQVKDIDEDLNEKDKQMLTYFALCTDAEILIIDGEEKRIGDPTETALIEANNNYGFDSVDIKYKYKRLAELPFDSVRKMMSVIVEIDGKLILISKGAPDVIIDKCTDNVDKGIVEEINGQMAAKALRVLGVGIKELNEVPKELDANTLENELKFIGLVGMIDPARQEVFDAIKTAKKAGIRTIMITGDHVITAKAIGRQLNILGDGEEAITGTELNTLSEEEFYNNIEKYSVYARVAPEDKVKIVDAWQGKGKVVAMTGDGVNDSPALKAADIGCAMGITGTDVAKEASEMILVDDNFATIIVAVKEGRGIYQNIKKTVWYLLSSNIGEVLTIFLASLISVLALAFGLKLNFGIPLLAMHLLWVNLITDSLPAFALGMEKVEDDVMEDKPREKDEGFFAHGLGLKIAWQGVMIGVITLIAYLIGFSINPNNYLGQTMAFLTLSSIQLFHSFNVKSEKSVFRKQTFNNKFLNYAFVIGMVLQLLIIYVSPFANAFKLEALTLPQLFTSLGLAFSVIIIVEIVKFIQIKNKKGLQK